MISSTARRAIVDAALDAWALLMPVTCAGCGSPDRSLCDRCAAELAPHPSWRRLADGTPVVSALDYSGVARAVILALKDHGRTDAARVLARPLAVAVAAAASSTGSTAGTSTVSGLPVALATIPPARASYRRRGYDPVALLLKRAGFAHTRVLRHCRSTEQQKMLDAAGRSRNLVGSLRAAHPLNGRRFIVVDDVMTTGATLTEAVRAIREAGGEVVSAATLAYTPRLFPVLRTSS